MSDPGPHDLTPRQLERNHQVERWMIRLAFGIPAILLMALSFAAGKLL